MLTHNINSKGYIRVHIVNTIAHLVDGRNTIYYSSDNVYRLYIYIKIFGVQ